MLIILNSYVVEDGFLMAFQTMHSSQINTNEKQVPFVTFYLIQCCIMLLWMFLDNNNGNIQ